MKYRNDIDVIDYLHNSHDLSFISFLLSIANEVILSFEVVSESINQAVGLLYK